MKLRPKQTKPSTQPPIFENGDYEHPWYTKSLELYGKDNLELRKPNPPSPEAVKKAKFVDKTYTWRPK